MNVFIRVAACAAVAVTALVTPAANAGCLDVTAGRTIFHMDNPWGGTTDVEVPSVDPNPGACITLVTSVVPGGN